MKTVIINPSYDYRGDGVIQLGVVLSVQNDEGVTLREQQFYATTSALAPAWNGLLRADLLAQIRTYLIRMAQIQTIVSTAYPTAQTFADAAGFIAGEIQGDLDGV